MSDPYESYVFDRSRGWMSLDIYYEPGLNVALLHHTGHVSVKQGDSRYADTWIDRLQDCKPIALHTFLVEDEKIPALFQPCVYDDKDSPSAVGGSGCLCRKSMTDPITGLPVVREHYRTVSGNIESWTYKTITSRGLPEGRTVRSLIVDKHEFWMRDDEAGELHFLPRTDSSGYGIGYGGGGPYTLCQMIEQLVESDGANSTPVRWRDKPNGALAAWARNDEISHQGEYTIKELRSLIR
ncbi:hypothetical protein [Streptomyces sp. NPDC007369]|uniref:hypothetical protein n=1 Tax=Streptomyces sp. NPDC007369 TaxID=3154589 RepID=UPI0034058A57